MEKKSIKKGVATISELSSICPYCEEINYHPVEGEKECEKCKKVYFAKLENKEEEL